MLDICWKCDKDNKIDYVWFDTGLEYQATKEHLKYLENKYNIKIIKYKAIKPIPVACKEYGQPFISKHTSQMVAILQRHNFKWEDEPFEELLKKYPRCKSALKWWCNETNPAYCIKQNRFLKEFMIENPITFKVNYLCCDYAKKNVSHKIVKENNYDLVITGIRKAEGGIRAIAYKSCYSEKENGKADNYRPLFWYKNTDKEEYEKHYKIKHSRCYTQYEFRRTGCACCPFGGRNLNDELETISFYEPKLYKAVNSIFKESYEYTRRYREYYAEKKAELKKNKHKE